jgi:hypothetical protein
MLLDPHLQRKEVNPLDYFYPWERLQPPTDFYVPLQQPPYAKDIPNGIWVLTPSGPFNRNGFNEFGLVTRQTPFGQGDVPGWKIHFTQLRHASQTELLRALQTTHPQGSSYHPPQPIGYGVSDDEYAILMSNWESITIRQVQIILLNF